MKGGSFLNAALTAVCFAALLIGCSSDEGQSDPSVFKRSRWFN